ncbi:MAG TPA: hypothetical protein VGZ29_11915 [Terriglobia bacterium]|nr:hypothetical protein [Terriglobia bacterium]
MKVPECHREQEVLDAVRSGRWSGPWGEEIRSHAAGCVVCAEVALVAGSMLQEHDFTPAEGRLPSAGFVWWKAQLAARRAAEERATQPITLVERFAQALALISVVGLVLWQWPRISNWFGAKTLATGRATASAAGNWADRIGQLLQSLGQALGGQSSGYLIIATATAAALLALTAFATYVVLREE